MKRQPTTAEEITQTLFAMTVGEVDCVRYRGRDEEIARRIVEMGRSRLCDFDPPADAQYVHRDRVAFEFTNRSSHQADAADLAELFAAHLLEPKEDGRPGRYKLKSRRPFSATVRFSWFQNRYHSVKFVKLRDERAFMAIAKPTLPEVMQGLARTIDRWLRATPDAVNLKWYSAEQWRKGGPWRTDLV